MGQIQGAILAQFSGASDGVLYQAQGSRFAESTTVIHDNSTDYPKGGKYDKIRPFYDAAVNGEDAFIAKLRQRGFSEKFPREYAAVWDETGKLHMVSMGRANGHSVQFQFLDNATVIHSHPSGLPPSPQDVHQFLNGNMKKMEIVTKNGIYSLTRSAKGSKLTDKETSDLIFERFNNIAAKRNPMVVSFDEWEKILDGTKCKISYMDS